VVVVEVWTGQLAGALRRALRMTARDFAEHLGAAVRTVAAWEAADSDIVPAPTVQAALDTMLADAPERAQTRFALMSGERAGPGAGWGPTTQEGTPTDRRDATGALLASVASAPVDTLAGALGCVADTPAGPVDRELVAGHERMFETLSGAYRIADPRTLFPVVSGYAASVLTLLDRPMTSAERRTLTAVAVAAYTEAGLVAFNAGQWPDAYRSVAVAKALAEDLDDPTLHAQTLGATSYLFSSALRGRQGGDPRRTVALLDQALDIAPQSDGLLRAWLAGWRADQHAASGDADAAAADLEMADRALDSPGQPRGFVTPMGCAYGTSGHLEGVRGQVDALLGRPDEAERTLRAALQVPGGPRQQVITLVRLAQARVDATDPQGASAALGKAQQLAGQAGYRMGEQRVRGVRSRFDRRWADLPCVVELDERLRQPA
jgi:tetratricopeptide (TPR) repeat protein